MLVSTRGSSREGAESGGALGGGVLGALLDLALKNEDPMGATHYINYNQQIIIPSIIITHWNAFLERIDYLDNILHCYGRIINTHYPSSLYKLRHILH